MNSLYLLIPIALVFSGVAIALLIWAISDGQYEDLDKEASRILLQERGQKTPERTTDSAQHDKA